MCWVFVASCDVYATKYILKLNRVDEREIDWRLLTNWAHTRTFNWTATAVHKIRFWFTLVSVHVTTRDHVCLCVYVAVFSTKKENANQLQTYSVHAIYLLLTNNKKKLLSCYRKYFTHNYYLFSKSHVFFFALEIVLFLLILFLCFR